MASPATMSRALARPRPGRSWSPLLIVCALGCVALAACKDRAAEEEAAEPAAAPAKPRLLASHLGDRGLFTHADEQPILGATVDGLRASYGAQAIRQVGPTKYTIGLAETSFGARPRLDLRVQQGAVVEYRFHLEYGERDDLRAELLRVLDLALGGKGRPVKRHAAECTAYAVPGHGGELSGDDCAPEAFACQRAEVALCESQALRAITVFVQRARPPVPRTTTPAAALRGASWQPPEHARPLPEEPREPSVTALPDGRLLLVGGIDWGERDNNAIVYDPAGGPIEVIPSGRPRTREHTATLLGDGTVLIAGGSPADVTRFHTSTAEARRFDPARRRWMPVPDMHEARYGHSAFLLPDGRVLVFGGTQTGGEFLRTSEIYDPRSNRWSRGPLMNQGRWQHAAVMLADRRILIAGSGEPGAEMTSEVYDPAARSFQLSGALARPWFRHQMALLADGRAWLVGESYADDPSAPHLASELYDPDAGEWMLSVADQRAWMGFAAVPAFGGVLLVGGHRPVTASAGDGSASVEPQQETLFFTPRTETLMLGPDIPASHTGDRPRLIARGDEVLLLARESRTILTLRAAQPDEPGAASR